MVCDNTNLDRSRLRKLRERENQRFVDERPTSKNLWASAKSCMPQGVPMSWMISLFDHPPLFMAEGEGAYVIDVDGHRYIDMCQADLSTVCGLAPAPVVEAVENQMRKGCQFLAPDRIGISVANELSERFNRPKWQFTLSASSANAEAIRVARRYTGRQKILLFDGKYHGHLDETLAVNRDGRVVPLTAGLSSRAADDVIIVDYNDQEAAKTVLEKEEIACVIVEPAITNVGVILPDVGFHDYLWELTRTHNSVLIHDETHTHAFAFGGLTREWNLKSDIVTLGKNFAGGVAIGGYGMSDALAEVFSPNFLSEDSTYTTNAPTGGTLYGNALSLAAAQATLQHCMTKSGYSHIAILGERLADGLESSLNRYGLPWSVQRLFSRSGLTLGPKLPRSAREAWSMADVEFKELQRVYMANRGVWEATSTAGPAASFPMVEEDIDFYLDVFSEFMETVVG